MIVGGAQENTLLTCRGLAEDHGDDVLLITGPSTGPEGSLLEQSGIRADRQGRAGGHLRVQAIPALRRAIHPWRDWQALRSIGWALREFKPDVVHTHSAKGGMLGRLAASKLKIPVIVHTVHGAPFHPYHGPGARAFFRRCEKYAARRCHALVSVADAMTDLMVNAGVAPREKFTTIYSGMEMEPFLNARQLRAKIRSELGYAEEHIVVAKVARLFHLKGHQFLLEAAPAIIRENPNVRFLLVGDGILKEKLQRRIAHLNLTEHFQFTGLVPPARIPALLGAADIVAHLSLREGLARVLPQALLAGTPVVSYDIDGARQVVRTNETGVLLPAKDIEGLVNGIVSLAGDEDLRNTLAGQGRGVCAEMFDHRKMVRELRELYSRLL